MAEKKRLLVLISGRGSNMQAIDDSIKEGRIPNAEIALVLSDNPDAAGLTRARERGLLASFFLPATGTQLSRSVLNRLLLRALRDHKPDLVCLAGYMRIVGEDVLNELGISFLNIHPSLLPSFPGGKADGPTAHADALNYGVKISGCTVHLVTKEVDAGPIVLQRTVPVLDDDTEDTLSARILEQEYIAYTDAINIILAGGWRIDGRRFVKG